MQWVEFPDSRLPVFGLPFFEENKPDLYRLPKSRQASYREAVWGLGLCPSGGRIRFATDAAELAIRLDYGDVGHMNNMHRIGQHAVDCYVDGVYWRNAAPLEGEPRIETVLFSGAPRARREVALYLPLYHRVSVQAIGLSDGARLDPPAAFARSLPVVFYGSSITQGGCATRSGLSYQAMLCRRLNLDHVNLGFSGNGRGEPAVAETMADIPASCLVMDYSQNCPTVEEVRETYAPFLAILRSRQPEVPIVCITPIGSAAEAFDEGHRRGLEQRREVIREAVEARRQQGDTRIEVIEGHDLLGPAQMDGIVDSSHPNDLGFSYMADGLEQPLAAALGL
ncbi:MAG: hypothetical protein HUU35_14160 [Armatimonadetes bacterium]|nr:hypothetical protein [Armatimonadota bacterium]